VPSDGELLDALRAALTPAREPDPARVTALRAAVAERAATAAASPRARVALVPPPGPRSRRWRVPTGIGIGAAAAVAAFLLGGALAHRDAPVRPDPEFAATLVSPGGDATAAVTGTKVGIGRVVRLATDDLPILPTGELYEVWFVGPGDTPDTPNRISAGTFHPDADGRSRVELTAAVDPTLYPTIVVTAEAGDGNPAPSGVEVMRADIQVDG
jgi:Anti-sigma-K factor rskA